MPNRLLAIVPVLTLLAACSAAPEEAESSTSAEIIGGTLDTGDPAVVGIVSEDGKNSSTCTGEIIAPTVVLTAAHCVKPSDFTPTSISIVADPDITKFFGGKGDQSKIFAAATATYHEGYDPNTGANDIAVITLARATTIKPLPFNRNAAALKKLDGKTGRAIGYGTTVDGDSNSANVKHQATLTLSNFTAATFLAKSGTATQCHGDSGGPVVAKIDGKETIIGIGWQTVAQDGTCGKGVMDTRVDPYVDFIDSFLDGGAGQAPGGSSTTPSPSTNSNVSCCVNGDAYACPTVAACLGGFDINACMKSCTTTACVVACANKASNVKPPTNACKPIGSCN